MFPFRPSWSRMFNGPIRSGTKFLRGGWSFTWDESVAPNPVIGVVTTYRSEWGDPVTGASLSSTWVCTVFPCPGSRLDPLYVSAWKKLRACYGTYVTHASIPPGEAACWVRDVVTILDVGDAAYKCDDDTRPPKPADAPSTWQPVCLQTTQYTIIGKDPVFER